jgi:hypothetical protein
LPNWNGESTLVKYLLCRSRIDSFIPSCLLNHIKALWIVSFHFGNLKSIQTFAYKALIRFNLHSEMPWIDSLFLPFNSIFVSTMFQLFALLNWLKHSLIRFKHWALVIFWAKITPIPLAYIYSYPLILSFIETTCKNTLKSPTTHFLQNSLD